MQRPENTAAIALLFVSCAVPLAGLTAYQQFEALGQERIEHGFVIHRHDAVLRGTAGDPWQYRILSEYLAEGFLSAARSLRLADPVIVGFFSFRVLQNVCIFVLSAFYYKRLGLNVPAVLVGISVMAWGMGHCFYDSDLQFNTYGDVIFYLMAALLLLRGRDGAIVLVAALAALNRETSLLIPFMVIAARVKFRPRLEMPRRSSVIAGLAGLSAMAVFVGLRSHYGQQTPVTAYGHVPGWDMLQYNAGRLVTWLQVLATVGFIPFMAIAFIRQWPPFLVRCFWCIVPLWLGVHLFTGVIAETRLLLVPHVLVFIPGALLGVVGGNQRKNKNLAASGETSF